MADHGVRSVPAEQARRLEQRASIEGCATTWASAGAAWALAAEEHRKKPNSTARWLRFYEQQHKRCSEKAVEYWNMLHPEGTAVTYWTGLREGRGRTGQTRSKAWLVSNTPVVLITGTAGGVALTHVELATSASAEAA